MSADGLSLVAHDDFLQSDPWFRLDLVTGEMREVAFRKTGDKSLLVDGVPFRLLDSRVFQPDSPVFQPDAPELPKLIRISDYRPPLFCAAAHRLVRIVQDDDAPANQDPRIINNPLIIGYDTVSMKPLFAFRSAHGCAAANIDANAGRLVVAGVDGSIEIWPLPW